MQNMTKLKMLWHLISVFIDDVVFLLAFIERLLELRTIGLNQSELILLLIFDVENKLNFIWLNNITYFPKIELVCFLPNNLTQFK